MEKLKHTQGPWEAIEIFNEKGSYHKIYGGDKSETSICNITTRNMESAEANAKLIAAAPDMLKFIMEMAERYENSPWISGAANELIKKALE